MKTATQLILLAALATAGSAAVAQTNVAAFASPKDKASYAIGIFFGNQLKNSNMDVDTDIMLASIKDMLAGRPAKLDQNQAREAIMAYQAEAKIKLGKKNQLQGDAFLAENKTKPGVKILPVKLPDEPLAELQYKILVEGSGAMPGSNDVVSVNYRGTLIDGTEFDSSAKHGGKPAQFPVNRVIRGWTEAMQHMKIGSKWQLFIPASLAYRDHGTQGIGPNSTLIFEVELLDAKPAEPAPSAVPAKPMTSDIIRVPSSEEMKKGAKIEVIKSPDSAPDKK